MKRPIGFAIAFATVVVCWIPAAAAEPLVHFSDPSGDSGELNSGLAAPWAPVSDIVSAELAQGPDGLASTIQVADLSMLPSLGVRDETMFTFSFVLQGSPKDGPWHIRGDFRSEDGLWEYSAEGPCRTNHADGSCPGQDRDIYRGLNGKADIANSTVTGYLPFSVLGGQLPEAILSDFSAQAWTIWPTYPLYVGDRAADETKATVRLYEDANSSRPNGVDRSETQPASSSSATFLVVGLALVVAVVVRRPS